MLNVACSKCDRRSGTAASGPYSFEEAPTERLSLSLIRRSDQTLALTTGWVRQHECILERMSQPQKSVSL
jgi:hypothetical protein